jgi:putative Ca2+/H+ antiporter (TMEM165/GDT1 family)
LLPLLFRAYIAVFGAEIVGDKLLYTTGVLATRYRTTPIVIGMAVAFMLKMAVAVKAGQFIQTLKPQYVAALTAVSFIGVAIAVWRKPLQAAPAEREDRAAKAAAISFATIFFSEWGDAGQIMAATVAAEPGVSPLVVWCGAVAAMATKGILAASVGHGVRGWIQAHIPPKAIRYGGVSILLLLGVLSVVETLTEGRP